MTEIQNLIKQGRFDEAAELAKKEYERTQNEKILNLYGIALFKKGSFRESAEVFEKLHLKHPENPKLLINYANSLIEAGDVEKAERLLRENAMLFPEEQKIYELIDECQRRKKEKEKKEKKEIEEKSTEAEIKKQREREEGIGVGEGLAETEEVKEIEQEIKTGLKAEEEFKEKELKAEEKDEEKEKEVEGAEVEGSKETKQEEIEEIIENIEEIKNELSSTKKQTKIPQDEEEISLEVHKEDTFLKRGRFLEVELKKDEEIIMRETFIVFISGTFSVFPMKLREGGRTKKDFFGGKNHKFIKIRGEDCIVSAEGEYISVAPVEENLTIFEHYLVGFTPSLSYDTRTLKVRKLGKLRLVELRGSGKVIIFTGRKKVMMKKANGYTRISLPNFIGATGRPKINIAQDSVDLEGAEKIIIRI